MLFYVFGFIILLFKYLLIYDLLNIINNSKKKLRKQSYIISNYANNID